MPLSPLRPLQTHGMDLLRESLRSGHRSPTLQASCGFGKTILSAHICSGILSAKDTCAFVVPTIGLIQQTFDKFVKNGIDPYSIGVMQADHPWSRRHAPLQICSAATLASRGVPDTKWVVVDENHIGFDVVDKWMDSNPKKRFIGLSATPWRKRMGDRWDDLIRPSNLPELTDLGWLTPIEGYSVGVPDVSDIPMVGDDYNLGRASAVMSEKAIVGDMVDTWIKRGEGEPTLAFAIDRNQGRILEEAFAKAGIVFAYVDAFTPPEERQEIFKRLRSRKIAGIVSIGTMIVGIDEDIRCISWGRLTRSEMLFVQAMGRGMRPADGKTRIILLDHAGTVQGTERSLGLPEEIEARHTHLHTSKQEAEEKANGKPQSSTGPKPIVCEQCTALIPVRMATCTVCGFAPKRISSVDTIKGELQLIGGSSMGATKKSKREPVGVQLAAMGMQEIYSQLLGMQGNKRDGWVLRTFKDIFKVWPPKHLKKDRKEAIGQLQSFVKSRNIAWVKGREKERSSSSSSPDYEYIPSDDDRDEGYPHAAE